MNRPLSFKIMVLLALIQGVSALLRAYNWVQIGVDLSGQGILLLPAIGAVAIMRGLVISAVALLYLLFFCGALLGGRWARWVCLPAILVNLLLVVNGLAQGAPIAQAIVWAVIPGILLIYIFSQSGRDALNGPSTSV
jgi:hypothetical protein